MPFLGYIICKEGMVMDDVKVQEMEWLIHKIYWLPAIFRIHLFLQVVNSELLLLKGGSKNVWNSKAIQGFATLKNATANQSETNPDPNLPFKSWPWSWRYRSSTIGKRKLNTHLLLLLHASTSPMGVVFFPLLVHDFLITGSKNGKTDALSQLIPGKPKTNIEVTVNPTLSLPLVGPLIDEWQKHYIVFQCHISARQDFPWSLWHGFPPLYQLEAWG